MPGGGSPPADPAAAGEWLTVLDAPATLAATWSDVGLDLASRLVTAQINASHALELSNSGPRAAVDRVCRQPRTASPG
jgi:hypothetical protein